MTTQTPAVTQASSTGVIRAAHRYLTGWRGLLVLATIALSAGAALNWSWLVAAGLAPLLITALPCVAMCALGLCANRMMGKSCSAEATPDKPGDPSIDQPPSQASAPPSRLTGMLGQD
jgi:hypothetical protein